jgi:hypothetical protein
MTSRLIQWDPVRIRIDADALKSLVGNKIKLDFTNRALRATLDVGGAPAAASVAVQAVNGGVTVSITLLPPPFLDLVISGAEIVPDGIDLVLSKGGFDLPRKSSS